MSKVATETAEGPDFTELQSADFTKLEVSDFTALEKTINSIDLAALFAPPTPEEIARRLKALEAFENSPVTGQAASIDDVFVQMDDERVEQIMGGHR